MSRRLRDQFAPVLWPLVRRLPWLVLMSLTGAAAGLSPAAQGAEGTAKAGGQPEDGASRYVRTYTKDELRHQLPGNPTTQLSQRLYAEGAALLDQVRSGFVIPEKQQALEPLKTHQPAERDWLLHTAALTEPPETKKSNVDGLRSFVTAESQKAATARAKDRLPILNKLSMLRFDLDLGSPFKAREPAPRVTPVRYGLIVQDIIPDPNAPKQAALSTEPQDLRHAGQAKVRWTIGPLTEDENRSLGLLTREAEEPAPRLGDLPLPSGKFHGSLTPETFDNAASLNGKDKMPIWRFDLRQEANLYSLAYRTKTSGERVGVEHCFTVPVTGTLAIGRRFSDSWKVTETAAHNVLLDQRLPQMTVRYLHLEERYRAEAAKTLGSHTIGAAARGKVLGRTDRPDEANEAYSLNYSRVF